MLKKGKKFITLAVTTMIMTLSIGATSFASPLVYDSVEGTGIEADNPMAGIVTRSYIQGDKVSACGGTLWTTWNNGVTFRANFDHSSKTHRSSVSNDHLIVKRSSWVSKGRTAISPWLDQTISNNKSWCATE